MNNKLFKMVDERIPMIGNLSEEERRAYTAGLKLLGITTCENFFDLPELSIDEKYNTESLFYEIPYFSSEQLWTQNNQRTIVVVYKIDNKSSWCPLRIDFKFNNKEKETDYWLYVYDQSGERTVKWEFVAHEGKSFTNNSRLSDH
ncbi:hypothetical protein MNQ98_10830 [Paenibacillus sp. N3/727]|uniref:hypothetical protein n=1 Tax=Paenibacillus sp. N3/727 TaxID=2925845 RepID=UPI001F53123A|nr:hypothetical protein [Paenibacillus sp. N3/727]UNK20468.1 hypothetical protein MNQ98_10830 [Paenibacillus sp. N3/727]